MSLAIPNSRPLLGNSRGCFLDSPENFTSNAGHTVIMDSHNVPALDLGPTDIVIGRELNRSEPSSLYEAQLFGKPCIMKLVRTPVGR